MKLKVESEKIYVSVEATDLRKGAAGLCALIVDAYDNDPKQGIYIFYNRAKNKLKLVGWHRNGFLMVYKSLEQGKFKCSASMHESRLSIDAPQLSWLLAGLDWQQMSLHDDLSYTDYY